MMAPPVILFSALNRYFSVGGIGGSFGRPVTPPTPSSDPMNAAADVANGALNLGARVRPLTGASMFTLWPEPAVGLSEVRLSDGPTGVRGLHFLGGRVVALLPNATLLASAWSEDTAREAGVILAEEAMAQQIHIVLGRRSTCTAPCSVAGCSRLIRRIRCSPGAWPRPTSTACNPSTSAPA